MPPENIEMHPENMNMYPELINMHPENNIKYFNEFKVAAWP